MSGNPRSAASLTGITRPHTCCIFALCLIWTLHLLSLLDVGFSYC